MAQATGFRDHLRDVQGVLKLSNMHIERLLARFKRNAPGKQPSIERVLGSGILSQWLHHHLSSGGRHPASLKQSDLIEEGVPLIAGNKQSVDGRKSRPNMIYFAAKYKEHKAVCAAAGHKVTRDEYVRTYPLRWQVVLRQRVCFAVCAAASFMDF